MSFRGILSTFIGCVHFRACTLSLNFTIKQNVSLNQPINQVPNLFWAVDPLTNHVLGDSFNISGVSVL